MAYRDGESWVVEPGDKVYWRNDDGTYKKARVPVITSTWVYLTAGVFDPRQPMGLTPETETWRERTAVAVRRVVPREACNVVGDKVYYSFERPTMFIESDLHYRRKAS